MQQDVFRLHITMYHAMPMSVVESARDLAGQAYCPRNRKLFLAVEPLAEGLAGHEGHDVEEEPVRLARVEEGQNMRMLQAGGGPDLSEEAIRPDDCGKLGSQHLNGHPTIVAQVAGEPDRGHPATAQLALEQVAIAESVS